jgi:hypothetical protein
MLFRTSRLGLRVVARSLRPTLVIALYKNTTTARISLFGTNAVYRTQTSTRDAVQLDSTQEQRPLLLRRHGDTVASTVDMAQPNSRARYMPQHFSPRRTAPHRAH